MTRSTPVRILLVVLVIALAAVLFTTWRNSNPANLLAVTDVEQPATAESTSNAVSTPVALPEGTVGSTETVTGEVASAASNDEGAAGAADVAAPITFTIDQGASEARFLINEVLLGMPTEVKGVTNLISGTITVDAANPAQSKIDVISIDARSLRTDRDLRNRAIRRFILESGRDEYQYITFTPTAISGLPGQAAPGDSFIFQVTGDLQIKDVAQPVTFDIELTAPSATQISGLAKAVVKRSDFNISIPSAPGVADVTDEVRLELVFVANAE